MRVRRYALAIVALLTMGLAAPAQACNDGSDEGNPPRAAVASGYNFIV
jgi:hypothetical protein